MRPWISRHLGTLVVGGIVLVALMASSATAALVITGADIKNNSVTAKDIKDGTLKTADLATKTRSDLQSKPFLGSACTVPGPAGGAGTVTMHTDPDGVGTLICSTPPVAPTDNDADGDGVKKSQECQDGKPAVTPAAAEVPADKIDNDCSGTADDGLGATDADADGFPIGGGDCDDTDQSSFPG